MITVPSPRAPRDASQRCACGHTEDLHHPAGRCAVNLPPYEEQEMPAWSCPCRLFATVPADVFRWHTPTLTWQAVALAVIP